MNDNKLTRLEDGNEMILGVCNGIAKFCEVDVTVVRLLAAASMFLSAGTAILLYLVFGLIMPDGDSQSTPNND